MTIKECIDIVDNAKPNQYSIKEKVMWLSFVDETIINDVLKTHEGYDGRYDDFTGYTEDKLSVPLIVPSPYDRLYPQYVKMMIDSENGETARYNNSAALYNTYLDEYKKYYNKTHMPIDTLKAPAPVNININSGLSEAQIENIKRQLYYMLSEDFSEATSRDKLYDIVTSYVVNNLEMLKAKLSMSYKGETSALPETAKIGDVYKLDSSVYRDGAYYIPIFANGSSVADGGTRYYFETIFADEIIDVVSAMVSDDRTNEFAFENNESKFEMPLIRAGYENNSLYIDSTTDTNDYIDAYFTHILVPEEYGEEYFADRKAVLFNKGELVVFTDKGWVSADAEMLKHIRYDIDDFKTEIGEQFNLLDGYYATVDLENVSNEVFKAKAEEAGVGGDAGLAGETSGGFKKIGFTEDCDYIATESDGYSAFNQAVSKANDGDVIVVAAGTYDGNYTLAIEKNITFVGIGKPVIKFPIIIGSYTQANTVNFDNFEFGNDMQCRAVDEWTPSKLNIYNSRFYESTTNLIGTFSNCKFDTANVSAAVSYGGDETTCAVNYNDCDIVDSTMGSDSAWYRNCTIRESYTPGGYSVYYTGCLLYNFTNKMNAAYQTALMRCVLYGNALPDGYNPTEYHECYLVSGVAL